MPERIGKIIAPEDFDKVKNGDDFARIDLGDELIPLIQELLRWKTEDRDDLKVKFDSTFTLYKMKVAQLKVLSQWPWEELQELKEETLMFAVDLKYKKNELDKLNQLIQELERYLEEL